MNVAASSISQRPGLLSLCSGTGMLDLAVELAWAHVFGIRPRVLGYAEREAFAAGILLARMEEQSLEPAPVFCGDFRGLDARPLRGHLSILAAGLPCQPYSPAGNQRGLKDARSWGGGDGPLPHALRIIEEAAPAVVCFENVPQWVTGGAFRKFGEELCSLGYQIEDPLFIRASDVGASHRRERVFILAYRPGQRGELLVPARSRREGQGTPDPQRSLPDLAHTPLQHGSKHGCPASEFGRPGAKLADAECGGLREQRGPRLCFPDENCQGMADAGRPRLQVAEQRGERGETGANHDGPSTAEFRGSLLAHAPHNRRGFGAWSREIERRFLPPRSPVGERPQPAWGESLGRLGSLLFAPGPESESWAHVLGDTPWLAPAIEPGVRLLVDGMALPLDASRDCQLRCGGNGVVVGQAAAGFVHLFKRLISR